MDVLFVVIGAVVLFSVAAAAAGRVALMDDDKSAAPEPILPSSEVTPADVDRLRFAVVARGYRMDHVDRVLQRLRDELAIRDRRIDDLEAASTHRAAPLPRRTPGTSSIRPDYPPENTGADSGGGVGER